MFVLCGMLENFGVGIDIVNINRFEKTPFEKNKKFYQKIFSADEIRYCKKFKNPYPHFAGKFAIKEATVKSIKEKISVKEIITYHVSSKPKIKLLKKNNYEFLVSVSHEKDTAIAVVISKLEN